MTRAIGIDLGTTYTVVATIEKGRPRIIPNCEGQHLTPSVVTFTGEGEVLVGQPAKAQATAIPERAVFSIKRRMGSSSKVRVAGRLYTPQEISGFILRKVKADAESYLGEKVGQAVITVPAYFNDRQRQATKEAASLAGIEVMRLINEPTAAALAYGLEREDIHTVLVWDLGGGTFDISILEVGEGIFEVRAVSGDSWLGGDDFDERIADYLAEEYRKLTGVPFPADPKATQKLRELAERAKIELSSSAVTRIGLPLFAPPESWPVELQLTRAQLEELTDDLLHRMVTPTQQALEDATLTPDEIDRVILVGGATRMPAVRDLARQMLGKEPYRYVDPDEVVAMGAAIEAGMLLGLVKRAVLLDVLPLSLGIETQGGLMARIIPRNTPLPASGARIFTTATDYQTSMDIHLLQGERALALDNISLGRFELGGIPSAPRGVPKVEVAFDADVDGIVHVSAKDLLTDKEVKVKVASTKFLDPQELDHLAREAGARAEEDRWERERAQVGIEANNLMVAAKAVLAELDCRCGEHEGERLLKAVSSLQEALASGVTAETRRRCSELREVLAVFLKEAKDSPGVLHQNGVELLLREASTSHTGDYVL